MVHICHSNWLVGFLKIGPDPWKNLSRWLGQGHCIESYYGMWVKFSEDEAMGWVRSIPFCITGAIMFIQHLQRMLQQVLKLKGPFCILELRCPSAIGRLGSMTRPPLSKCTQKFNSFMGQTKNKKKYYKLHNPNILLGFIIKPPKGFVRIQQKKTNRT